MSASLFLSCRDTVSFSATGSELVLENATARLVFKHPSRGIRAVLEQLANNAGEYEDRLMDLLATGDGPEALARYHYYVQRLFQRGLLICSARLHGSCLATLEPASSRFLYESRALAPDQPYVLSRFAYLRRQGCSTVLESPRARTGPRITLHDWRAAALVHALAQPGRLSELCARLPRPAAESTPVLLTLLLTAEMVHALSEDGTCPEEQHPVLQSWEFHDLLFHARSRSGRHDGPVGATYRLVGRLEPPPAVKPPMSAETIDLYRPDLEQLVREDLPLTRVQEQRRSVRNYGAVPLDVRQLGEFLYRVGRVKEISQVLVSTPSGQTVPMDFARRPYPGSGALYELEFYVTVNACADLARGLYHYDPLNHRLERLAGVTPDVDHLLAAAAGATGISQDNLQVLITIAARFQRIAWKYASMAYSAILKHVGVVYQTMYLVATAMGLAPCAIGNGDSDCFARAAGLDYYAETSVGEFLLGNRIQGPASAPH